MFQLHINKICSELQQALKEAREKTNLERLLRLPDVTGKEGIEEANACGEGAQYGLVSGST